MLRLSVVCLSSSLVVCLYTECTVAKRCVLEQKLLLTAYRKAYEKSIGTKMNDLEHCLEVVSRSCQPLRYIRRWISRKPLEIEAWFQRTTNRKSVPRAWGGSLHRYLYWNHVIITCKLSSVPRPNRKWHMDIKITWPMTPHDPQRCCEEYGRLS